jgi:hypothetical protein
MASLSLSASGWKPEDCRDWSSDDWNSGSCDIIAIAISRLYGLTMYGEFESLVAGTEMYGKLVAVSEECTSYLLHAFCRLPDGRAVDASGPFPMPQSESYSDDDDPDVCGSVVIEVDESDSRLTNVREFEYSVDVDAMGAPDWVRAHLGQMFSDLGIPER